MHSIEMLRLLAETALAMSLAIVLVLALRAPLRRRFGAGVAYAAWWIVPAATLAVLLPAAPAPMTGTLSLAAAAPAAYLGLAAAAPASTAPAWALAGLVWAVGATATALLLLWRQWRFQRGLGALQRQSDGLYRAQRDRGLPAAIGLLRPRIVVPDDFEQRYSAAERSLIRAHERSHIVRGDLHLNAGVALLSCLYWFNPLLHYAVGRFRADQEFACDARVLRRRPGARRSYGEAMLKSALRAGPAPWACSWASTHPIAERIAMLKHPLPGAGRVRAGAFALVLLGAASAFAAWAAQPAASTQRLLDLQVDGLSERAFARHIAAAAGMRLANPEVLEERPERISANLRSIKVRTAFMLLEDSSGWAAEYHGDIVRFVPSAHPPRRRCQALGLPPSRCQSALVRLGSR